MAPVRPMVTGGGIVGRESESARLNEWLLDRVCAQPSGPTAVFITGEAGLGKTALVGAVTAPFLVGGRVEARRAAASPWRSEPYAVLAQLVPEVVADLRDEPVRPERVREALLSAGRPVVVALDDLHWCDDATLALLAPLIDLLADDPVGVIGLYRNDELPRDHLVRSTRAQLRRHSALTEIALPPLDAAGQAELVAALVGATAGEDLLSAVRLRTEGVPFFVEELVAALARTGWLDDRGGQVGLAAGMTLPLPDSIRDAVLLRLAAFPPAMRAMLEVAAVLGPEFDPALVEQLTGAAWPDELDHTGLLSPSGPDALADRRRFRHALTHEAVYGDVPWSRRRALHRAVARRLTELTASPALVARHLLAAGEREAARPVLVRAADEHLAAFALRDAAQLLDTALESWPAGDDEAGRLAVVERLARCAELCGDYAAAVTGLRELADATKDPQEQAMLQRRMAAHYEQLGHWPSALSAREAAALVFRASGMPGEAAVELLAVATHLRSAASFRAALDVLDRAEPAASEAARVDLVCRLTALRGNVLARMGRADEGLPLVRDALAVALSNGFDIGAGEIYQRLADSLENSGDLPGATRAYESAYDFCESRGADAVGQLCRACATVVLFNSGRWDLVRAVGGQVVSDGRTTDHARAVAQCVLGLVDALQGRTARARAALLEARQQGRRIELVPIEILSSWGLAVIEENAGRNGAAAAGYRQLVERARQTEDRHYCLAPLPFAIMRFAEDGLRAELGDVTTLLSDAVATTGQQEAAAAFAVALAASADRDDDAIRHLRRAIEHLEGVELPLLDVMVRRRLGNLLARRADAQEEAHRLLSAAQRTARRLKARYLIDGLRTELASLQPAGVAAGPRLSGRESEVIELVGDGLTNREIAARLFLSVRTVEMHVAHALTKLGARTRSEAVTLHLKS